MTPAVHIRMMSCREKLSLLPVSVIFPLTSLASSHVRRTDQDCCCGAADGTVQTSWADTGSISAAVPRWRVRSPSSGREPADDGSQRLNNFTSVLGTSGFIIQQVQACSIGATLFSAALTCLSQEGLQDFAFHKSSF